MLEEKVLHTIKEYCLIQPKDTIIIAVSGGPDSMCLLHVLNTLKEELEINKIIVAHVNHQIREEAEEETLFVRHFCETLGIECWVKYVDVLNEATIQKKSVEEMGREIRYDFFEEVLEKTGANRIAIAHNSNDNAETVLMHLLRGSGISGLSGIKPSRENGKIIRPLIECSREEIEEYCPKNHLAPKIDKTNQDNTYTRNKIRNELIPYLKKEFNPNLIETLQRIAKIAQKEEKYIQENVIQQYQKVMIEEKQDEIVLDLKQFIEQEEFMKSNLVLYCIHKLKQDGNTIGMKHIEDIIKMCNRNIGNKYLIPRKEIKVLLKKGKIFFIRRKEESDSFRKKSLDTQDLEEKKF